MRIPNGPDPALSAAESSTIAKRILYFDALESFAIFLVVAVHSVWLNGDIPASISMSLSPVAVPLFFMVHGALLLSRKDSRKKHLRRSLRVVSQLLIWLTIYLIISLFFGWNKVPLTRRSLYQYYFEAQSINGTMGLGGSLWFIYALLFIYLLHPILYALRETGLLRYLALLLAIFSFGSQEIQTWGAYLGKALEISSFSPEYLFRFFNPLGRYGNCVFYYILGYLLFDAIQTHSPKISSFKRRFLVISGFLFVSGLLLLMIERRIEFGTYSYNWKPLSNQYYRLGGILQAIGLFCLFSQIHFQEERCGILKAISTHTIDIYYIHPIIVKLMYDHLFKQAYAGVLQNYIRAVIALIISFYLGQFIRRIPFLKRIL